MNKEKGKLVIWNHNLKSLIETEVKNRKKNLQNYLRLGGSYNKWISVSRSSGQKKKNHLSCRIWNWTLVMEK